MSNGALDGLPGGAIMVHTSALDLTSCIFEENFGSIGGAIVSVAGSSLIIDRQALKQPPMSPLLLRWEDAVPENRGINDGLFSSMISFSLVLGALAARGGMPVKGGETTWCRFKHPSLK